MFKPKLNWSGITFKTVETHTMGEPTRIITSGFPILEGKTMMERKEYLEQNYDHYRSALMLEPRGHKDMFGALLTEPINEEADLGVIFMDSGGYLNMCGHGSIGVSTIAVETGLVEVKEPFTDIILDAPAGVIRARVKVENKKAVEVSFLNVPAFLYKENIEVEVDHYGKIEIDISFGGSFFALVDAEKIGIELTIDHINELKELGMRLLTILNKEVEIQHPYLNITSVDLVEFYGKPLNPKANLKNVVIFGDGQVDRSPCGTGTSAKIAYLYAKGKLKLGQEFVYESITGSMFRGVATKELEISGFKAVIPQIIGSAYITGINQWMIDEEDMLGYGFVMDRVVAKPKKNVKTEELVRECAIIEQGIFLTSLRV